jgi:hypothetical protein
VAIIPQYWSYNKKGEERREGEKGEKRRGGERGKEFWFFKLVSNCKDRNEAFIIL